MSKTLYATLGVAPTATRDQIKRAYRKLARRFHPGVSHASIAQERFKDVAAAHETLIDPERCLRYDGELAPPPPNGHHDAAMHRALRGFFATTTEHWRVRGEDQHAVVLIELADAYRGATRSLSLQMPAFDGRGVLGFSDRQLEVQVPKGVLDGQHLRLKGQGAPGQSGAAAGDLYLEVVFMPHPPFRLAARDVYLDLAVAPWEAMLGATITVPTPTGSALLTIPPGSAAQQRLRLKGLGLPGSPPGDLYVVLGIALPPGDSAPARQAWRALASAFPDYQPRG